ncbi:LamG-like jellyroll fold domain-containing protein [Bdellovibrio sp. ArHS]
MFGTNQQTYIGKFPGNVFYFNGHMDDFRIYNRVLTEAEILKISQQN